ncbi:conserved hypothetical protein [Lebetimonas natsushimae]|uniref:ATPase AAA-type core domain-containing protein n=1 Tax=Lebetimonas natsushimae TaxID=1936991 RepID=A0A292YGS0_9BACT|nr:ATP-binding protein [Lebetimonas natsushimae]GAX88014.1 conserved hypothetical protein [Lebetimonas natsushimae]
MKFKFIKIKGYKNLDFEMKFPDDGVAVFIGNNGSGKSNLLEAISLIFGYYYNINLINKLNFEYVIRYEKNNEEIVLTNNREYIDETKLPDKIICYYSGEEARLWNDIYKKFYEIENKKFINNSFPRLPSLLFLNKYYWKIALIMLVLNNKNEKEINLFNYFDLNEVKYKIFKNNSNLSKWKSNAISQFINNFPEEGMIKDINFGDLKEFFFKLYFSYIPKNSKFIDNIQIFDIKKNKVLLSFIDLSEGEKRFILYKFIIELLATQDTLLLFDEIDNNIHPANKKYLKKILFENFIDLDKNIIFTTHSPTLTTIFETKNNFMLDSGKIISYDKKQIIKKLTENKWSYFEINELLTTNEDIVLVEGSTDVLYLEETLKLFKNKGKFKNLSLKFIPAGGANNDMEFFIKNLTVKENQKIFVLLDNDEAGKKAFKKLEKDFSNQKYLHILNLPKPVQNFTENDYWEIEDFFDKKLVKEIAKENFKKQIENNLISFPKLGKNTVSKSSIKGMIKDEFDKFKKNERSLIEEEHLSDFEKIFKLIEKVKNEPV